MRPNGKTYDQCSRYARSLGWNANNEEDQYGFNEYVAKCMYGQRANEQLVREFDHFKATRGRTREVERQVARRSDKEQVRYEQARRRELQEQAAEARRALARAEPRYRRQAVYGLEYCQDLATIRAWSHRDEEDGSQTTKFVTDCMRGLIPR